MSAPVSLSLGGKVFFGSLCAGTFGLGCWQTQRLFEKQKQIEIRQEELELEPASSKELFQATDTSFRRYLLQGKYLYDKEVLVGPRGPPPGALPDQPGASAGGMSSAPQGYFVVTPLQITGSQTVLVNRGWVPRNMVVKDPQLPNQRLYQWDRPRQTDVQVTAIQGKPECKYRKQAMYPSCVHF
jgi:surfeit locus 1 family protein